MPMPTHSYRRTTRRGRPARPPFARGAAALMTIAALALLLGCSPDDESVIDDSEALPGDSSAVDEDVTVPGDASIVPTSDDPSTANEEFEGIRLYPGSEAIGSRTVDGSVVSQSFTVTGPLPEAVLSHFTNTLEGWEQGEVEDVGDALRTEFTDDGGSVLEVSATVRAEEGLEEVVQYSLVLHG